MSGRNGIHGPRKVPKYVSSSGQPDLLSKPEQVISYVNGKHRLHCEGLEKIFRQNRHVPLIVVSINGPTGKGKSMMINLLANKLQHLENKIQSPWEDSEEIVRGMRFEPRGWQGERTLGVHMWHRPFVIPTKASKVAVLLADCQGSNGLRNSNENIEHEIQLLSLTLADVQLINVDECIDSMTLESIKNLVESMSKNCSDSEFPEDLIFLCRNVPQAGEKYGEQKKAFANAVNGCDDAHQPALRCIKDKFNSETTFTFPYPGPKAAGAKLGAKVPLRVKDLPSDFIASVVLLTDRILRSRGSGGTGDSLIRRFKALKEPVESGQINEGLATASNVKRHAKAMKAFENARMRVDQGVKQLNGEIIADMDEAELSVKFDTKTNEIIEDYNLHAITSGYYCKRSLKEYIDEERSKLIKRLDAVKREIRLKAENESMSKKNMFLKGALVLSSLTTAGSAAYAACGGAATAAEGLTAAGTELVASESGKAAATEIIMQVGGLLLSKLRNWM